MIERTLSPESPSRVRFGVLGFVGALSMITYLDRVCFGTAAGHLIEELHLGSEADLSWAFAAFTFAYAVFEVPTGWLGDVFGPRQTLIRIVLWWSLFTALTGLVGLNLGGLTLGFGALVVIRFLFGVGEAGAYPNTTRALHNWFPFRERGLAQGAVFMAARVVGGLTPLIWWLLTEQAGFSWRIAFWLFGCVGILWCLAFASWFRNRPEENPKVNEAELVLITAGRGDIEAGQARVPWMRLLTNLNLWTLCLLYFGSTYAWYFNITYLPRFLDQIYADDAKGIIGSIYKGGPLLLGAVACIAGGWITDGIIRRTGDRKWGRRACGMVGHTLSGLCYLACLIMPDALTFALAISCAAFWNDLALGSEWAVCQDIGKRYSAIVAGCMNTIGNLGGTLAGWSTGHILDLYLQPYAADRGVPIDKLTPAQQAEGLLPGYHVNFLLFGLTYLVCALLWLRVDPTKPVFPEEN